MILVVSDTKVSHKDVACFVFNPYFVGDSIVLLIEAIEEYSPDIILSFGELSNKYAKSIISHATVKEYPITELTNLNTIIDELIT